ncbi:DUF1697 domain-containing protein [Marnyiella aurantia]|uniref:DUF1697 domain-containing protein n=1 Tax=Marnyiella aurantia TaxID=2758037 RepID=A0A7D7QZ31_9FLAO|nr:DUF1697 domain-containing protein [Marnyiella aurantia]MBA5245954.1 DUF1697 domain-containing protein [Marnyiella aurantia]QMS98651.1 DUF1697 domain-containing protein [Marnyiella aurantia]
MKYCAFLRGVNVNGTSMKMAEVCSVFESVGMEQVTSVLASGNILFSSERRPEVLKTELEKAMSAHFNYDAFMFLRSEDEITAMLSNNPFEAVADFHTYIFIGQKDIEKELLSIFSNSAKSKDEKGQVVNSTFYWQVPKGNTLHSAFGKVLGRKSLKDKITSRNINTFDKIINKLK